MPFFARIFAVLIFLFLSPSFAQAEVLVLKNGDTLSGEMLTETEKTVTFRHAVLGVLTVPKDQLQPDTGKTAAQQPTPKPAPPGIFGTGFLAGWKRHVALGVQGEQGNDVSLNINGSIDASYEDSSDRLAVNAAYFYESQDHERNTSKGNASFIRDWLLPDNPWFYYAYSRYDYDEFKSWEQRLALIGGTGYGFFDEPKFKLHGRIGLGGNRTWGDDDDFNPEAQLGLECHWLPNTIHSVSAKFSIFPDLNLPGEYRTQAQAKWEIKLSVANGLGLELGFDHEYESKLQDGLDRERHYSLLYFGRLGLDL